MEDKQCKQTERFSVMAEGSNIIICNATTNCSCMINPNKDIKQKLIIYIQEYDPYQIKKEKLSRDISKFPPVQ